MFPFPDKQGSDAVPEPMRSSVRFPLHLPMRIQTESGEADAVTEDISSTGVSFLTDQAVGVGSVLQWSLRLPAEVMGSSKDVTVQCTGRVMWSHGSEFGHRIGAVIDEYILKDS